MARITEYRALFDALHPGFFEQAWLRELPPEKVYEEMALDLAAFNPKAVAVPHPEGARFGFYGGDPAALMSAVARVDADWPRWFGGGARVYCGFMGDEIASFCLLDEMGTFQTADGAVRVAGPGCVGTVPEWRRQGIGLEMVRRATAILRAEGHDLSWIHYTGVAGWYAKLGYRTVLRWNGAGFIDPEAGEERKEC